MSFAIINKRVQQYISSIGAFYKNEVDSGGLWDCEELVGIKHNDRLNKTYHPLPPRWYHPGYPLPGPSLQWLW